MASRVCEVVFVGGRRVSLVVLGKCFWVLLFMLGSVRASSHIRHVQYNISEGVPEGHMVGDLLADSNLKAEFHSDIIRHLFFKPLSKMPANISIAQNSGTIVVTGEIDREEICLYRPECELNVDIAVQPNEYFRIIKVNLHIIDVNDNFPTFTVNEFVTTLSETSDRGTIIQLPYAEDRDTHPFGVKKYKIQPKIKMFRLKIQNNVDSSQDVSLVLNGKLDFEKRRSYNVSLIAEDGGVPPKSGSIQIVILIADANDHIPEFDNSTYEISVSENIAIGSTLLRVRAHDRDSGLNAAISYSFSDRTHALYHKYFAVNNITGDIVVRDTIDYEINHVFQLSVVARDSGQNSHAVDSTVIVRVLDENDCTPEIDINTLHSIGNVGLSEIREESPVGSFLAHVTVTDRDSEPLGTVHCHITNPNFLLSNLTSKEYLIETAVIFDREVRDSYIITIYCKDSGIPPKHAEQRLLVKIVDINDHKPIFSKEVYEASILENNYSGQEILQVNASDGDSDENGRVSYFIVDNQYKNYFTVGESNGVITSLQRFDREKRSSYTFTISAKDNGPNSVPSLAKVIVTILDVNDEAPLYMKATYEFSLLENEEVGTYVGSVTAEDKDSHANSQFSYRFVTNSERSFLLDPISGDLSTTHSLDREERSEYHLVVEAKDKGIPSKSSRVDVIIKVLDQNDNTPQFLFPTQSNNTVQIPAILPEGYVVAKVLCADPDAGDNGLLQYHLVTGGDNLFKMNITSGILYTHRAHQFDDGKIFEVKIVAADRAKPSLSDNSVLYITVNSSLVLKTKKQTVGILHGTHLKTIIIVAVILGIVLTCLLIVIILVYCRRSHRPRNAKQRGRYDKFHVRPRCGDQREDKTDSSKGAVLHSTLQDYTKDAHLLGEYEYLRRPPGEPLAPHLNYLLNKTEACHHNDYHKPRIDIAAINKSETDQDSTYSGDGSNTDSGKGPSEEGDNSHTTGACTVTLTPVLEEDHRSHEVSPCSAYNTYRKPHFSESSPQYGFHRTMPHTVISGIPKCKCKSCNTNRFKTGTSKPKDIVFPAASKEDLDMLSKVDRRTSPEGVTVRRGCKAVSYQKVAYGRCSPNRSPARAGREEEEGSSTTSGSYVVDHHDLSDVMNDSHWDITKLPQHSVV